MTTSVIRWHQTVCARFLGTN